VLSKQVNIAWVEALGFVKVGVATLPVASGSLDIGEGLKNPTVVRQQRMCLLQLTHGGVVILEAGVVIIALG